jgi:hypothetical protein
MTPRRIIHWKSFWLGIVVMGFLVWGWLGTRTQTAMLYCIADDWIYAAGSGSSSVHIAIHPHTGMPSEWGFDKMPSPEEDPPCFAPAFENGWIGEGPQGAEGYIAVAYWVVVLAFVVLWVVFLGWRWRRVRRLMSAGSL